MKRPIFFIIIFLVALPLGAEWKAVGPGLEYRRQTEPLTHFFRIDLKRYRLDLLMASDYGSTTLTADRYRERSSALLVINGGFFNEFFRSLGLLVRRGKVLNPIRETTWGVFLLGGQEGRSPSIISRRDWKFANAATTTLAIQVGPRLVIDGSIPSFKEGPPSRRSAIGVTKEGMIEIALSESPLHLREWAEILRKDCPNVLNLDGGGSSQIVVRTESFSLQVYGLTGVPNAIGVFRR